jgi:GNAT superfamily N-acetyltransferase
MTHLGIDGPRKEFPMTQSIASLPSHQLPRRPPGQLAAPFQLLQVAEVLAAAFEADPVASWVIPNPARRFAVMRDFFHVGLAHMWLPEGLVYTVDPVVAAGIWMPPGTADLTEAQLARLLPALEHALGDDFPTLETLMACMDEHHPRTPHYYLAFLGTRPAWQSQGYGSALLQPGLERADAAGLPAYTEATSERNRALYARHGFAYLGPLVVHGGPTLHRMWREPR